MLKAVFQFHIQAEKEAEFLGLMQQLIAATRKEEGCVTYQLFRDAEDPCAYAIIEEWASPSAMEKHKTAPHCAELMPKMSGAFDRAPSGNLYSLVI